MRTPPKIDCGEESTEWWLAWDHVPYAPDLPPSVLARCVVHRIDDDPTKRRRLSLDEYDSLKLIEEVLGS